MEINYEENRIFAVNKEAQQMGELTFKLQGDDVLIADSTQVEEEFRGEGIGGILVEALVKKSRKDRKKIMAKCPFVKKTLQETPAYHDVFLNL